MNELFKVEKIGNSIKISNNSKFNLWIGFIPEKPKIKIKDSFVIAPKDSLIFHFDIDLTKISFRFLENKHVR